MDDEIYKENILDHYRNPHHHGTLAAYDVVKEGTNPSCGDELTLYVKWDGDAVSGFGFTGQGCAISQAATSMLSDKVMGMKREEIAQLSKKEMDALLGIPVGESREKCEMLGLITLQLLVKK